MNKNLIILAVLATLLASTAAVADSDSNGGVSAPTQGGFGSGSDSNGGVSATTQGAFGSGSDSNGGVR
jgi:opacity protein-like surface antigen